MIDANRYFTKKERTGKSILIYSVLNIIENEYMSDIGLEVIAYRLGISPNHLGSAFKNMSENVSPRF